MILANSFKHGGRCIAGKAATRRSDEEWDVSDEWIRPVTKDASLHGAIPLEICSDRGSRELLKVMDLVEIDLLQHVPEPGQPENWTFSKRMPWRKVAYFRESHSIHLLDRPSNIWFDPASTNTSLVTQDYRRAGKVRQSLLLIQPSNLRLHLSNELKPWEENCKRKMHASFYYNGTQYSGITVTDPFMSSRYSACFPDPGDAPKILTLPRGDSYNLCISLAPPLPENNHSQSKLVAAVIGPV